MHTSLLALAALLALSPSLASLPGEGDHWPGWRGPRGAGIAAGSPPIEWSEQENIRWKVPLPGKGLSCPVVWGDLVIVTTAVPGEAEQQAEPEEPEEPQERGGGRGRSGRGQGRGGFGGHGGFGRGLEAVQHEFLVVALERATGEVAWEALASVDTPPQGSHGDGSFATATPATNGQHIVASFGSNGVYCYTMEGELAWEVDLGDMEIIREFGEGSSPVLAGDKVVIVWDHEGDSFIVALELETGEEVWRVARPRGTSWTTPLIVEVEGEHQVIVGNTQAVAYDLEDGAVLWACGADPQQAATEGEEGRAGGGGRGGFGGFGGPTGRRSSGVISSPVHEGGLLVTSTGSRRGELRAIDLTEARGTFEDGDALVWTFEGDTPHVPSPIAYGGIVYVLKSNAGQLSAYDIVSGERYFGPVRMEGAANIYASPVAAGGYIYFTDREGTVEVVKAGEQYEVAAVNELGERVDASPAISGDELFIRGHEHLFCIARKDG